MPQGEAAEDWRAGVKDREARDESFRYGIIQAHVDGTYAIRYDDGKGHNNVDPARCEVDWVQPDAHTLATAARKGEHACCLHDRRQYCNTPGHCS